MNKEIIVPMVAIIGIIVLGTTAVRAGIDSGLLVGICSIAGGIAGYRAKVFRDKQAKK